MAFFLQLVGEKGGRTKRAIQVGKSAREERRIGKIASVWMEYTSCQYGSSNCAGANLLSTIDGSGTESESKLKFLIL